jgi:hypothetical protein
MVTIGGVAIAVNFRLATDFPLCIALTPRAVVNNFMSEDIAVNAEVVPAHFARVSAALADSFRRGSLRWPVFALFRLRLRFGLLRERTLAGEANGRLGSFSPWDLDPVPQGEQMVI